MKDWRQRSKSAVAAAAENEASSSVKGMSKLHLTSSAVSAAPSTLATDSVLAPVSSEPSTTALGSNLDVKTGGLTGIIASTQQESQTAPLFDTAQKYPVSLRQTKQWLQKSPKLFLKTVGNDEPTHSTAEVAETYSSKIGKTSVSTGTPSSSAPTAVSDTALTSTKCADGTARCGASESTSNLHPSLVIATVAMTMPQHKVSPPQRPLLERSNKNNSNNNNPDRVYTGTGDNSSSSASTPYLGAGERPFLVDTPVQRLRARSTSLPPAGSDGSLALPRCTNSGGTSKKGGDVVNVDEHAFFSSASRRGLGTSGNEYNVASWSSEVMEGSRRGRNSIATGPRPEGGREQKGKSETTTAAAAATEGPSTLSSEAPLSETVKSTSAKLKPIAPSAAVGVRSIITKSPSQLSVPAIKGATEDATGAATTAVVRSIAEDKKAARGERKAEKKSPTGPVQLLAYSPSTPDSMVARESVTLTDDATSPTTTTSASKKRKKKKIKKKKAATAAATTAAAASLSTPGGGESSTAINTTVAATSPTAQGFGSGGGGGVAASGAGEDEGTLTTSAAVSPAATAATADTSFPLPPVALGPSTSRPSRGDAAARQAAAAAAAAAANNSQAQHSHNKANSSNYYGSYGGYGGYPGGNATYEEGNTSGVGGDRMAGARMTTPPVHANSYGGVLDYNNMQLQQPQLNGGGGGVSVGGYSPVTKMVLAANNNSNSVGMVSGGVSASYGYCGNPHIDGMTLSHQVHQRMMQAQQQQRMAYPPQGMMMNQNTGYNIGSTNSSGMRQASAYRRDGGVGGYQQLQQLTPPQQQQVQMNRRTTPAQGYYDNNKNSSNGNDNCSKHSASSNCDNNTSAMMPVQVLGGYSLMRNNTNSSGNGGVGTPSRYYVSGGMDNTAVYASAMQQEQQQQQHEFYQRQRGMHYGPSTPSASTAQVYYPVSTQGLQSGTGINGVHHSSSSSTGVTPLNSLHNGRNDPHHRLHSTDYRGSEHNVHLNCSTRGGGASSKGPVSCPVSYSAKASTTGRPLTAAAAAANAAPRPFNFTPEVSPRLCRLIEQEVLTYLTPSLSCLQRRRAQLRTLAEYITAALRHAGRQTGHDYGDISFYIFGSVNMRTVLPDGDNDVTVEVDGLLSPEASKSPPPLLTAEEAATQRAAAATKPALPPVTTDSSAGDVDGTMQLTTTADGRPRLAAPAVLSIASGEVLGRVRDYLRNAKTPLFVDSLVMAEVRVLKLVMEGCNYDITIGQFGGVNCVRFLHEMDAAIGGQHLLKRTLLLLKAWSCYEAHVLGGQAGYIGSYAATVMLISMLNTVEFLEDVECTGDNSSSRCFGESLRSSTAKHADASTQLDVDLSSTSRSPDRDASAAGVTQSAGEKQPSVRTTSSNKTAGSGNDNENNDTAGTAGSAQHCGGNVADKEEGTGTSPVHAPTGSLHQLSPVTLLARFLKFFAHFDFDHYCVTAFGPLPLQKIGSNPVDLSYLEVDAAHSRPLLGDAAADRAATDINFLGLTAEGEATIGHLIRRRQKPLLTVSGVKHLLDEVNQSRRAERQAKHTARQTGSAAAVGENIDTENAKKGVDETGRSTSAVRAGSIVQTPVQLDRAGCTAEDGGLMCPSCNTAVFPVRDMNVLDPLRWSSNMVRGVCRNHLQRIRRAFLEGVRLLDVASHQLGGNNEQDVVGTAVQTAAAVREEGTAASTSSSNPAGTASPASQQLVLSGASSCPSWTENNNNSSYGVQPVLGTPVSEADTSAAVVGGGRVGGKEEEEDELYPGYPAPHSQCTRREVAVLQLLFPRSIDSIRKNSASNCPWNHEGADEMAIKGMPQCPTCTAPSLLCTPDIHRMCEPQLTFHAVATSNTKSVSTAADTHCIHRAPVSVGSPAAAISPTASPSGAKARSTQQQQQQMNSLGRRENAVEQAGSELEEAIAGEDISDAARNGGPLGEAMVPPVYLLPSDSQQGNNNHNTLYSSTHQGSNGNGVNSSRGGGGGMMCGTQVDVMQPPRPQHQLNNNTAGAAPPSMMQPHGLYSPGPAMGHAGGAVAPYDPITMNMMVGAEEDYYTVQGGGGGGMGGHRNAQIQQQQQSPQHQQQQQQHYLYTSHSHLNSSDNGYVPNPIMMVSGGNSGGGGNDGAAGGGSQYYSHHYHHSQYSAHQHNGSNSGVIGQQEPQQHPPPPHQQQQPYVRVGNMHASPGPDGYHMDSFASNPHPMYSGENTGLMGRTYTSGGNNNSNGGGAAYVSTSSMPLAMSRGGAGGCGRGGGGWPSKAASFQQQQMQHGYVHSIHQQQQQQPQRGLYVEGGRTYDGARSPLGAGLQMKVPGSIVAKEA